MWTACRCGMAHAVHMTDCIVSVRLLEADEEATLARAIEAGVAAEAALAEGRRPGGASAEELNRIVVLGRQAWEQFLLANTRLVRMISAKQARNTGLDPDDLFQEGFVALTQALQRYDHTKGRFATYAVPRVRQAVAQAACSRLGALGLPASVALVRRRALAAAGRLDQVHQRTASLTEVSQAIGRNVAWTHRVLAHMPPASLSDHSGTLRDLPAPPGDDPEDTAALAHGLTRLSGEEHDVLRLRFGLADDTPRSYAAVATRLGRSATTVRRIERRALTTLRCHLAHADQ